MVLLAALKRSPLPQNSNFRLLHNMCQLGQKLWIFGSNLAWMNNFEIRCVLDWPLSPRSHLRICLLFSPRTSLFVKSHVHPILHAIKSSTRFIFFRGSFFKKVLKKTSNFITLRIHTYMKEIFTISLCTHSVLPGVSI